VALVERGRDPRQRGAGPWQIARVYATLGRGEPELTHARRCLELAEAAIAWFEAALRERRSVVAVRTANGAETRRAVDAMKGAGGHFINRFGRLSTEEVARWRGPEAAVTNLMKH